MEATPNRVEALFAAAAELTAEVRNAFLDNACGDDRELRRQLDGLLGAHDRANHVLDRPAAEQLDLDITRDSSHATAGTVVSGRYKLLEAIGEGPA